MADTVTPAEAREIGDALYAAIPQPSDYPHAAIVAGDTLRRVAIALRDMAAAAERAEAAERERDEALQSLGYYSDEARQEALDAIGELRDRARVAETERDAARQRADAAEAEAARLRGALEQYETASRAVIERLRAELKAEQNRLLLVTRAVSFDEATFAFIREAASGLGSPYSYSWGYKEFDNHEDMVKDFAQMAQPGGLTWWATECQNQERTAAIAGNGPGSETHARLFAGALQFALAVLAAAEAVEWEPAHAALAAQPTAGGEREAGAESEAKA